LILLANNSYFAADRDLISSIATARRLDEVEDAIVEFTSDLRNVHWFRTRFEVRVSRRRVRAFARGYLSR